jgi:hypothetical protein
METIFQAPFNWIKAWNNNCGKTKQWLLAGEFSEFEYSRETRRFLKCARLARLADIRQAVLRGLARLADICQPFTEYSPDSPTFAKLCCVDSPDSRKASLASFTQI